MYTNMQFAMNSFRKVFPDMIYSPTFPCFLVKSPTAVKFPDISRQLVTLRYASPTNRKVYVDYNFIVS